MAVRGVPAKDVGWVSGAEVRIFSPTPNKKDRFHTCPFCLARKELLRASLRGFAANEVRKCDERRLGARTQAPRHNSLPKATYLLSHAFVTFPFPTGFIPVFFLTIKSILL